MVLNTVLRPKRMNMIDSMKHRQKQTRLNDASALRSTRYMTIIIRYLVHSISLPAFLNISLYLETDGVVSMFSFN